MWTARPTGALLAAAVAVLTAACGSRPLQSWTRTMPSPDGCFVQVWNQPGFAGRSDFINGPIQYPHLRDLPDRRSWKDQIGSLKLGPGAAAVAWSQEQFSGDRIVLVSGGAAPAALPAISLNIQSLDITCGAQGVEATN
jgi:hypothetical protein